jgi:hypothetical protein
MIGHFFYRWLYIDFWCLIWPNAGAMPLCAIFGFTGAWLFRDRIGKHLAAWFHHHHGEHLRAELGELERRLRDQPPGGPR